jgi:acylphosphatase
MACVRCLVTGRVQGVFFRASTREQAEQLGLSGHVRNRPDARVEVVACGTQAAVVKPVKHLQATGSGLFNPPVNSTIVIPAEAGIHVVDSSGFPLPRE